MERPTYDTDGGPPPGFTIRIFVAEGTADGLRLVGKSNWVGQGLVFSREGYPQIKDREELSRCGVYMLIGREGDDERPTVYIGEGESVRARLDMHAAAKSFWQEAIVFTTKGDPLHKAQVQFLESALCERARRYKRCRLDNGTEPSRPGLPEPDEAEIRVYLSELLSLLPILGVDVFEPVPQASTFQTLYYLRTKDCDAVGFESPSGFVVRKGSHVRGETVPSMEEHMRGYYNRRLQLIDEGVLEREDDHFVFTVDHEFRSPSSASTVCAGRSSNGLAEWKDEHGVNLGERQQALAEANPERRGV
ncbi:MAG: DUF4357 domain-containing protein [Armatimonadia bacterium]|nr:DUF4357 domain-containing protein [Armatimonadia bacterium]